MILSFTHDGNPRYAVSSGSNIHNLDYVSWYVRRETQRGNAAAGILAHAANIRSTLFGWTTDHASLYFSRHVSRHVQLSFQSLEVFEKTDAIAHSVFLLSSRMPVFKGAL